MTLDLSTYRFPIADPYPKLETRGPGLSGERWQIINPSPNFSTHYPIPACILDMHIRWDRQFSNHPTIQLLIDEPLRERDFKFFTRSGTGLYHGLDEAGEFSTAHWHTSSLSRIEDSGPNQGKLESLRYQGYGGRVFEIVMHPQSPEYAGETIRLVGPYHHAAPRGWCEVHVTYKSGHRDSRPWHRQMHFFGYYLPEQTIISLFQRYFPALTLYYTEMSNFHWIEPGDPEKDNLPKTFQRRPDEAAVFPARLYS